LRQAAGGHPTGTGGVTRGFISGDDNLRGRGRHRVHIGDEAIIEVGGNPKVARVQLQVRVAKEDNDLITRNGRIKAQRGVGFGQVGAGLGGRDGNEQAGEKEENEGFYDMLPFA